MLDQLLKRKAIEIYHQFERTHKWTSFGCRCHKGVSNYLIPFIHPSDKQTNPTKWYVFIGQFALIPPTRGKESNLATEEFRRHRIVDLPASRIASHEREFIKQSAFWQSDKGGGVLLDGLISSLTWLDYLRFQSYVLARFEEFLFPHFNQNGEPSGELREYIQREEQENEGLILQLVEGVLLLGEKIKLDPKTPQECAKILGDLNSLLAYKSLLQGSAWNAWLASLLVQLNNLLDEYNYLKVDLVKGIGTTVADGLKAVNNN